MTSIFSLASIMFWPEAVATSTRTATLQNAIARVKGIGEEKDRLLDRGNKP